MERSCVRGICCVWKLNFTGRPCLFSVAGLSISSLLFVYQSICLSVVVGAHFSLRTTQLYTHTHTHTHKLSILALSSNETTMVQPLARQPRWTDHFDVRLDMSIRTNTHKQSRIERVSLSCDDITRFQKKIFAELRHYFERLPVRST